MKKLSVVLPTGGNNPERIRNLEENLKCLRNQTYKNWELIIVEQSMDGKFYHQNRNYDQYKGITDEQFRGFNLSWCRNVGAKMATGDIIVLMDADYVFRPDYLEKLAGFNGKFSSSASHVCWTSRPEMLNYYRTLNPETALASPHRFIPFIDGKGYACIIMFDREWYHSTFVGYVENFFRYGCEDVEAVYRIMKLLKVDLHGLERPKNAPIAHLFHGGKDYNLKFNCDMKDQLVELDGHWVSEQLRTAGVGNFDHPSLISI